MTVRILALAAAAAALTSSIVWSQTSTPWVTRDHPAIQYSTREPADAIVKLNERIAAGSLTLSQGPAPRGYLESVLKALDIPVESQVLVFSPNSLQGEHISMKTPRALYFNDEVAIGWANGADTIEATAFDARQGVHFYSIAQKSEGLPEFVRRDRDCLQCHLMPQTQGVPGLVAMSMLPLSDNPLEYADGWPMDHRTPLEDRWGGWYVTGEQVPAKHIGNVPVLHVPKSYVRADVAPKLATGREAFDAAPYPAPHSDIAALMVFNHQLHMTNLLIRLGWLARIAAHERPASTQLPPDARSTALEVVDYMLFLDEAPLPSPIRGNSGFTQAFAAKGPKDARGRSLRDVDLTRRLLKYPCSYMIYTDAFDALPAPAKGFVYAKIWEVLSGTTKTRLSLDDRRAIVEILRTTKKGLPDYFAEVKE